MIRKWCAVTAVSVLLTLPMYGQTARNHDDGTNTANEAATTKSTTNAAEAVSVAPASTSLFAVPALPRATPFPSSDTAKHEREKERQTRLFPRYEVGIGFSFLNVIPGDPFKNFNSYGVTGSFTYNAARWIGFTGEVTGYKFDRTVGGADVSGGLATWVFGPRFNFRHFEHVTPFVEALFGGSSDAPQLSGTGMSQRTPSVQLGGGIDIPLNKYVAWRFAQIDYFMTNFSGPSVGIKYRQDNFKAGTALIFRWGYGAPPPPPPPAGPPVASCSANPTSLYVGSNDSVAIHVTASSPANLPLTYNYTATGGKVDGTGADARWNSSGTAAGGYTVSVKVDDGKGGSASCSADVRVEAKPHHPPTITCAANPSTIQPGERSTITATANSPDNLNLTYTYSASAGQVAGSGSTAQFDSTGLQSGNYTINCGVSDERGDRADASTNVNVQQPPPPPQATKIGDCGYRTAGSSRVDNVCKRVLDDVSLRLKNEPNAKLVIVGYADGREPRAAKLAATRADLAKKYLGEKGIDASRISVRTGSASKEKGSEKENRRIEAIFVPDGANY